MQKNTIKKQCLDYFEGKGEVRKCEIMQYYFLLQGLIYDPINDRGHNVSAFYPSVWGQGAYFLKPTKNDPRHFEKVRYGVYKVVKG